MSNAEKAVSIFGGGINCAQAVFGSYASEVGVDYETALKIAAAFGGGMRMGEVCGAVTGALMVLGMKYAGEGGWTPESKERTNLLALEFAGRFKERQGSVICKEILGCDVSTSEGMSEAKEKNLFKTLCPRCVQDASEILEQMMRERE